MSCQVIFYVDTLNLFSDDPEKWIISQQDRSTYLETGKKGPRCNRCRHFGHIASKCPEKPYPPQCKLCGSPDHQEPRCPNKMCTQVDLIDWLTNKLLI